jgi:hypothetical protein
MRKTLLIFVLTFACHRPGAPPAPATPSVPDPDPDLARLPIPARLAREAQRRPAGTPRVEEVMAALGQGGVPVERVRQVLASTIGASFCAAGSTAAGTTVAVCEFPSEEVARRGMSTSHQLFDRLIPGRTLVLNRKTLLTVAGAEAQAARSLFAHL